MAGTYPSSKKKTSRVSGKKIAIIVAEWNEEITEALYNGAVATFTSSGIPLKNIIRKNVPGSFELPLGAQKMASKKEIDAVICLGCVVQGETPHFDFICQATAYGIMKVSLRSGKPVVFGVLTTLNKMQAIDRAGGKVGNKGEEAALTALQMLNF